MDLPDVVACCRVEEPPVPVVDEEDESIGFPVRRVWIWWRWVLGGGGCWVKVEVEVEVRVWVVLKGLWRPGGRRMSRSS
jgi:hypothetical protein